MELLLRAYFLWIVSYLPHSARDMPAGTFYYLAATATPCMCKPLLSCTLALPSVDWVPPDVARVLSSCFEGSQPSQRPRRRDIQSSHILENAIPGLQAGNTMHISSSEKPCEAQSFGGLQKDSRIFVASTSACGKLALVSMRQR